MRLILVRHAKAESRDKWVNKDDLKLEGEKSE